jgi:hypothetical protein
LREQDLIASLNEAVEELVAVRRARRLSDQRADELTNALAQSQELSELLQARIASLQKELSEAQALAEQRLVELATSAHDNAEKLLTAERQVVRSTEQLAQANAAATNRLVDAERRVSDARVSLTQIEARAAAEAERWQSERAALSLEQQQLSTLNDEFRAEAQSVRAQMAHLFRLVRAAVDEEPTGWHRLGHRRRSPALQALAAWSPPATAAQGTAANVDQGTAERVMQAPLLSGKNPYHRAASLAELLEWHDAQFVRCAYVTVLGRQPDPDGEDFYTRRIREGASKLQVLWQLRTSKEAARHDPGIAGFDRTLRQFRLARLPLIGPLLSPRFASDHTPAERRLRKLENEIWRVHALQDSRFLHIEAQLRTLANSSVRSAPAVGKADQPIAGSEQPATLTQTTAEGAKASARVLERFPQTAVDNIREKLGPR